MGNPADLAEFLGNMGLGKYAQALTENEIDLEAVQLMAESDFEDIGKCCLNSMVLFSVAVCRYTRYNVHQIKDRRDSGGSTRRYSCFFFQ